MFASNGISSYPKVYNIGHPALTPLITAVRPIVSVEEKLDGSQISFGIDPTHGEVVIRSKGASIDPASPPKLFALAVESIKTAAYANRLPTGTVFRAEAICSRRHNSLQYDRIPEGGLMVYDIEYFDADTGGYTLIEPARRAEMAREAGFESVPVHVVCSLPELFGEDMSTALDRLLSIPPVLGGDYTEGVVIKSHDLFGVDGKFLIAKHVRPAFRELHAKTWKPNVGDGWERAFAAGVLAAIHREARWEKAVSALRERGELLGEMRDMPTLMQHVSRDGYDEIIPVMQDMVTKAWKQVSKGLTAGFAEWYKERLVGEQAAQYALSHAPLADPIPGEAPPTLTGGTAS